MLENKKPKRRKKEPNHRDRWMDASVSNRLTAAYHAGRLLNQLAWQLRQAFFTASVDIDDRVDDTLSCLIAVSYGLVEALPNQIEDATTVLRQTWKEELCCEEAADAIAACVDPALDFDAPSEKPGRLTQEWVDPLLKKFQVSVQDKLSDSERWALELGQLLDQGVRRPDYWEHMKIIMNVHVNPDNKSIRAGLEGSFQPAELEADATWPRKLRKLFSKVGMPTALYDRALRTWERRDPRAQLTDLPKTIERLDRGIRGHLSADGPVPPFTWRRGGKKIEDNMQPAAWKMLDFLWKQPDRAATFDDLKVPIYDDANYTADTNAFGSLRRAINNYFKTHRIPWQVCIRKKVVSLTAAE